MSSTPPNQRPKILAIDGSYRRDGITDQLVDAVLDAAEADGVRTERVHLVDERIAFCRNCRACAAAPLESAAVRGACQLDDAMAPLLARIDAADGLVIAAPINFGSVTAVTKRFMERLICYAYWPWGQPAPTLRRDLVEGKKGSRRPAVLVTSSAAPSVMARFLDHTLKELKQMAEVLGTEPVGSLWAGLSAQQPEQVIRPVRAAAPRGSDANWCSGQTVGRPRALGDRLHRCSGAASLGLGFGWPKRAQCGTDAKCLPRVGSLSSDGCIDRQVSAKKSGPAYSTAAGLSAEAIVINRLSACSSVRPRSLRLCA